MSTNGAPPPPPPMPPPRPPASRRAAPPASRRAAIRETIRRLTDGEYDAALTAAYHKSALQHQRERWRRLLERAHSHPYARAPANGTPAATINGAAASSEQARRGDPDGAAAASEQARAPAEATTEQALLFRSPGRTEIGGNHTDHNHGLAIVGTLTDDIIAVVWPRSDTRVRIHNTDTEQTAEINHTTLEPLPTERGKSAALIRGVAAALHRHHGLALRGFDALTTATVAAGSGLSSSAAFESLVAVVLHHLAQDAPPLSVLELAKVGQYAENEYFGKPCGLEDQIGCLNGGLTEIDFADFDAITLQQIQIDFTDHGIQLGIVDSGEDHADLTEHYAAIPGEMRQIAAHFGEKVLRNVDHGRVVAGTAQLRAAYGDRALLRALHFFRENERVKGAGRALRGGDMEEFLRLVRASGNSSWMWLQNCIVPGSTRAQAMALTLALTAEFIASVAAERRAASRVHGGGFAGAIQTYTPQEHIAAYRAYIAKQIGADAYLPLHISARGAGVL